MFTTTLGADRIRPFLRGRFGSPYLYFESCESTQRVLTDDLPEGAVAVAEYQTAGRGRLGRSWDAPVGTAILCSILLRPPATASSPQLSLVGGVATALAVERAIGRPSEIKWPNDVMVDSRKVAGVLAELRGTCAVLGVGVNVNQSAADLPINSRAPAASLFVVDESRRDRAPLLADLLLELERSYDRWLADGLAALLPELAARDFLRGRRVTVGGASGTAVGIAVDGRLEIDAAGERLFISSGDVSYEP